MDKLFLGIHSHVVCVSKKTGDKIWDTKIKSAANRPEAVKPSV